MKIGFMSNQLDNRGTGNALFNYAKYNQELLNNESVIITRERGNHDSEATDRFLDNFSTVIYTEQNVKGLDALYHIKSGYDDGTVPFGVPYLVHAVFDNDPHGSRYATISPWMGTRFGIPYVPHIVEVADTDTNLRKELGIPEDAVVFARYGGRDSFDISYVWDTIFQYAVNNPNVYFIFMNTDEPQAIWAPQQFRFLPGTVDPIRKRQFINTSDAMLHARGRGETFGIAVGEFAICGKPIITSGASHERAHLQELGHFALEYAGPQTLRAQLDKVVAGPLVSWGYGQYTPENVMKKFQEVFLT